MYLAFARKSCIEFGVTALVYKFHLPIPSPSNQSKISLVPTSNFSINRKDSGHQDQQKIGLHGIVENLGVKTKTRILLQKTNTREYRDLATSSQSQEK